MVFNTMGWFVENATCANHNHGRMGYLTSVQSVLYRCGKYAIICAQKGNRIFLK